MGPRMPMGIKITLGVVLIAIVAAILIPNLLSAKVNWHDMHALATLRNLAPLQDRFRAAKVVDLDQDGRGEFGTFGELTGADGLRTDPDASHRKAPMDPAPLSVALANTDDLGRANKSGYFFRILLPGKGGTPVHEGRAPAGEGLSGPVDTDGAERSWCAYAWPVQDYGEMKGESRFHRRVFFVDEGGDVWQTFNLDRRYWGTEHGPSWYAAMPEDGWGAAWTSAPVGVEEYRGRDGNVWTRKN